MQHSRAFSTHVERARPASPSALNCLLMWSHKVPLTQILHPLVPKNVVLLHRVTDVAVMIVTPRCMRLLYRLRLHRVAGGQQMMRAKASESAEIVQGIAAQTKLTTPGYQHRRITFQLRELSANNRAPSLTLPYCESSSLNESWYDQRGWM